MKSYKELENDVIDWGIAKGIFRNSDSKSQLLKTVSEVGELADAINKGNRDEAIDAVGDVLVTLILLCKMEDLDMMYCLESAYDVIAQRTGSMVNGVFVKDAS